MEPVKCSACGAEMDPKAEGIPVWEFNWCSKCFYERVQGLNRPMTEADAENFRLAAKELSGLMPASMLEMILVDYWRRTTGRADAPPREETLRAAGELQRLTAFANFAATQRLLKGWSDAFNEFVEDQGREIREKIERLTHGE